MVDLPDAGETTTPSDSEHATSCPPLPLLPMITESSNDNEPTMEPNDAPPAAPPGTAAPNERGSRPRQLTRSADRKIAGVAGGIARYFGIDPVIVRLGFVVGIFAGGIGVFAYLLGWLVLPNTPGETRNGISRFDRTTTIALVMLAIAGWIAVSDPFDGGDLIVPLVLVGAGVYILSQRPNDGLGAESPTPHRAPLAPEDDAPATQDTSQFAADYDAYDDYEEPPPPPRAPAVVTRICLSVLALFFAGSVGVHQLGWVDVDVSTVISIALIVVGAAGVVGAFVGRSRGLVAIGILLLLAFGTARVLEPVIEDGVGERLFTPASVSETAAEYKLGIGELVVDLRELEIPDGEEVKVKVTLGIGEARVLVPPLVDLEINADEGVGHLDILSEEREGIDNEIQVIRDFPGDGKLIIELDIGIGEGKVRRG